MQKIQLGPAPWQSANTTFTSEEVAPSIDEAIHVLHVDNDPENLQATKLLLDGPGLEVLCAASAGEALSRLEEHDFALALMRPGLATAASV